MKRFSKYLFIFSIFLLILLPIILYILIQMKSTFYIGYAIFFRETYFTILLGCLLISIFFYNSDKWIKPEKLKEKKISLFEIFWIIFYFIFALIFIYLQFVKIDSIFFKLDSIIPILPFLAPDLFTFLLWFVYFLILANSYVIFQIFKIKNWKKELKELIGSILLSNIIVFTFSIFLLKVPFFNYLEDIFHSLKYSWLRNPGNSLHPESGLPYCQTPYDESGKKLSALAPNPPLVRNDIEIIGITNLTIEKLQGNWPIDWKTYATLTDKLSKSKNNILLFDISFLDDKGIYGGNYCGILFDCKPLNENIELKRQSDLLAEAISKNPNIVLSDYPLETTDEARSKISNFDNRL